MIVTVLYGVIYSPLNYSTLFFFLIKALQVKAKKKLLDYIHNLPLLMYSAVLASSMTALK